MTKAVPIFLKNCYWRNPLLRLSWLGTTVVVAQRRVSAQVTPVVPPSFHPKSMFERNQFTSLDILALTNFTSARTLMDATLWGPVSNAIASKLGRISRPKRAMTQLFDH